MSDLLNPPASEREPRPWEMNGPLGDEESAVAFVEKLARRQVTRHTESVDVVELMRQSVSRAHGASYNGTISPGKVWAFTELAAPHKGQRITEHSGGHKGPPVPVERVTLVRPYWVIAGIASAFGALCAFFSLLVVDALDGTLGIFLIVYGLGLGTSCLGLLVTASDHAISGKEG
jgi:hypothetical protein